MEVEEAAAVLVLVDLQKNVTSFGDYYVSLSHLRVRLRVKSAIRLCAMVLSYD